MKEDTSVKYFHSAMDGAPVLSGTPGATIAVLDACLVDGWGLKTVDSLVVAGNVATATISTGHAAFDRGVVLIAGASPAELNGEWRVSGTTATTVTFTTAGVADQTATGAITLKIAPAGWAKVFSSTNIAVYQSTDVASTQMYLRVDDTGTTMCRVVGYETMSSADVGAGPFPTTAQRSGGAYWQKSNGATTDARPWSVVADTRIFYYGKAYLAGPTAAVQDVGVFGDIQPVKSVDPFACVLFGVPTGAVGAPLSGSQLCADDNSAVDLYAARSHTALGGSAQCNRYFARIGATMTTTARSGVSHGAPYPNPADGGLYLSNLQVTESANLQAVSTLRGAFPGYYCAPQIIPWSTFAQGDFITAETALPGRTLIAVQSYNSTPPNNQTSFIDITGPWR